MWILLSLQYDGYDYHGWVKQQHTDKTIQTQLEIAFFKLSHKWVWSLAASKTDAQVHAFDQRVIVKLDFTIDNLARYQQSLNRILPRDIKINWIKTIGNDYNVRKVVQKEYNYTINDFCDDIKTNRFELRYLQRIDLKLLEASFAPFVGTHDFFYFSGIKMEEKIDSVRTISKIKIEKDATNRIVVKIFGPSFIRYQIRMIVGNALRCYENKITIQDITKWLKQPQGMTTNACAKPYGLCLKKIWAAEDIDEK